MDLHTQEFSSIGKDEGPCSPSVKPESFTLVKTQDHPSLTRALPRLWRLKRQGRGCLSPVAHGAVRNWGQESRPLKCRIFEQGAQTGPAIRAVGAP